MKELIEFLAKSLVNHPEAVMVTERTEGDTTIFELKVAPDDMGKVIGKQGKIAKAIRTLVRAASTKDSRRVNVEIV
ncbi:KH domain-containing protein [Proteiniclasticum sp. QWL-01]|uniref:KH domain-containing protein n=1 Tax=Proteiniclasticum sp. QWL-01 TaxID=3036945 RepID=UPI00220CE737|nr:KH domain-containing protein [Proteiniclasticum sp. QWL-01]UUM12712.1 KH domain-containing protein [Clostridiaceae bacterium HFYG-1003]WFF74263.1 KH domain-containing protein [Proteiniclasticum sp. QWL-01]